MTTVQFLRKLLRHLKNNILPEDLAEEMIEKVGLLDSESDLWLEERARYIAVLGTLRSYVGRQKARAAARIAQIEHSARSAVWAMYRSERTVTESVRSSLVEEVCWKKESYVSLRREVDDIGFYAGALDSLLKALDKDVLVQLSVNRRKEMEPVD